MFTEESYFDSMGHINLDYARYHPNNLEIISINDNLHVGPKLWKFGANQNAYTIICT